MFSDTPFSASKPILLNRPCPGRNLLRCQANWRSPVAVGRKTDSDYGKSEQAATRQLFAATRDHPFSLQVPPPLQRPFGRYRPRGLQSVLLQVIKKTESAIFFGKPVNDPAAQAAQFANPFGFRRHRSSAVPPSIRGKANTSPAPLAKPAAPPPLTFCR